MSRLSSCCLTNPTHSCIPLIPFDHYHFRLWPKLDAAWLIIWQSAANYLPETTQESREGGCLPEGAAKARPSGSTSDPRQVLQQNEDEWKEAASLHQTAKFTGEENKNTRFLSDENNFHHSPNGRRREARRADTHSNKLALHLRD